MNILGFVSMLLIMMGVFFASFQDSFLRGARLQKTYIGFAEASRSAQNQLETNYYKSFRKKPKPQAPSNKPTIHTEQLHYIPKKFEPMPECARFNFSSLLTADTPEKESYDFCLHLIKTLYGSTLLKDAKEDVAEELLNQIIDSAKKVKKNAFLHLAQLRLQDPALQALFYKMLKGGKYTGHYEYPSLLDYVKLQTEEGDQKICLSCCDSAMLSALFGQKVAENLEKGKKEKMDQLQITNEKLQEIVQKETIQKPKNTYTNLISCQHKNDPKKTITGVGTNQKTSSKIKVKKSEKLK